MFEQFRHHLLRIPGAFTTIFDHMWLCNRMGPWDAAFKCANFGHGLNLRRPTWWVDLIISLSQTKSWRDAKNSGLRALSIHMFDMSPLTDLPDSLKEYRQIG